MAVNIYDLAHDLDKGIRETPEFISLQDAYREVNENADAKAKFERFRDVQVTIQENK